jgi:hypothetical protein
MKMVSELHRLSQGTNQRWVASAAASVIVFSGRSGAQHFASRAASKAVEVNRLPSRPVGQLRSPRSFVQHRNGVHAAILFVSPFTAAGARLAPLRSSAKISRARQQSNNTLVPTAQRHAPLGPRACGAAAAQRRRWAS